MFTELQLLLYEAEEIYLNKNRLNDLKEQASFLSQRIEVYKLIRDNEIEIFQYIANELEVKFTQVGLDTIEQALIHWLSVLRYSSMALLLDNPEFLTSRLLEWLTGIIEAHQQKAIANSIYDLLTKKLKKVLSPTQFDLIQPFLFQAQETLLKPALV